MRLVCCERASSRSGQQPLNECHGPFESPEEARGPNPAAVRHLFIALRTDTAFAVYHQQETVL